MYLKFLALIMVMMTAGYAYSQNLLLAEGKKTGFGLVLPERPTAYEEKAAKVFADYFQKVTGASIPMVPKKQHHQAMVISIGHTKYLDNPSTFSTPESFRIRTKPGRLLIEGEGRGVVFAVYHFIEQYLGCRKYDQGPALVMPKDKLELTAGLDIRESPAFIYREAYFPIMADEEYRDWHRLHRLDDHWGLWGHSFEQLLPAADYFRDHPEYFALTGKGRNPAQLCLSNEAVFRIIKKVLAERIAAWPDARYWSISPNDSPIYCECEQCSKTDAKEGGPQGSLVNFVNRLAAAFPGHQFSTLAYTYSAHPTRQLKPARNVSIMLSSIDALRTYPFYQEPTARPFCKDLEGWKEKTPNIFVWDYCTQFTNYLSPFPNLYCLQPNYKYLQEKGVKGVFAQGSGADHSDLAELKAYLIARLLWQPSVLVDSIVHDFLEGYYGKAGLFIQQYLEQMDNALIETKAALDIYGNPVNEVGRFLSPARMEDYSHILDKAEAAVEQEPQHLERVLRLRLSLDYASFQQARFYGREKHGIFQKATGGEWQVREGFRDRYDKFIKRCGAEGVSMMNEDGKDLQAYQREWSSIFNGGVRPNLAYRAGVQLERPHIPDYAAASAGILVDGNNGFDDFSYNWLCFNNEPLQATLDMGEVKTVDRIALGFLEDPRHWFFLPSTISVWVSVNGKDFEPAGEMKHGLPEQEGYAIRRKEVQFSLKESVPARYVKVIALPQPELPIWRQHKKRKAMLACDEVWVN
ncbi:DUF4838 domain-containing protein [Flavihumibacter rivuli]|uniref:DUF4838 domain-containing protein n=1 Tax=Flavihumibacter rivuli TaxID=2838156 RepID=UPI001BDF05F0|nr:DUF4838 domain-containing protein [Flavihumibacter rivuli]ULQ56148.1 DUF4838 domain-containing protein [Flavihumibacter rivuli]